MFLRIPHFQAARAAAFLCSLGLMLALGADRAGAASSGEAMPSGDLDGFKQVFKDDFNTNVSTGNFPGSAYQSTWETYPDGIPDTFKVATQYPSKVLSVGGSNLTWNFHYSGGKPLVATAVPKVMGPNASPYSAFAYGRYSVRVRSSNPTPGYMPVFLLWPDSGKWPDDGEIDYPGGDISSTIYASLIRAANPREGDHVATQFTWTSWHTMTIDWRPGIVTFFFDGQVIGSFTTKVPHKPMHWVLQVDSSDNNPAAAATATGNLEVDWVSVWRYQPGTLATTAPPTGEAQTGGTVVSSRKNRQMCKANAKPKVVSGILSVKFPKKTKKRRAMIPNTKLTNFRKIDLRKIGNGSYRLITKYKRKKHGRWRTVRGCRRITVAN